MEVGPGGGSGCSPTLVCADVTPDWEFPGPASLGASRKPVGQAGKDSGRGTWTRDVPPTSWDRPGSCPASQVGRRVGATRPAPVLGPARSPQSKMRSPQSALHVCPVGPDGLN